MTLAFYEQERVSNFEFYSKLQKFEIDKLIDQLDSNLPSKADICKELISHVNKVSITRNYFYHSYSPLFFSCLALS
jgi:Tfp pilus assembly protein PilO